MFQHEFKKSINEKTEIQLAFFKAASPKPTGETAQLTVARETMFIRKCKPH